jgi:hypothetical protein
VAFFIIHYRPAASFDEIIIQQEMGMLNCKKFFAKFCVFFAILAVKRLRLGERNFLAYQGVDLITFSEDARIRGDSSNSLRIISLSGEKLYLGRLT